MIDIAPALWASIFFGGLAILLLLRFHIAAALMTISVLGAILLYGPLPGVQLSVLAATSSISTFTLTAIPLFILMGELLFRSGLALAGIRALDLMFARVRGRVAYLTVGAGGVFGVLSGSAVASTGVLGGTLVPEMLRRGYSRRLAAGSVLGAGGLAMILPPSAVVIVWGATAGVPIGPLLIAGIIPGIMMALGYAFVVFIWSKFFGGAEPAATTKLAAQERPGSALGSTNDGADPAIAKKETREAWLAMVALGAIVATTLSVIIAGIATPSESASIGLVMTVIAVAAFKRLSIKVIVESVRQAILSTGMIFFLILGASIYAKVMAGSGVVREFVGALTSFSDNSYVLIVIMLVIVIVLGLFLESIALVLLTIPLFNPIISTLGIDPIWFGLMMIIAIQIGTVTPPMGMSLFVIKRYMPASMKMSEVYKAVLPFVSSDLLVIIVIMMFPILTSLLPSLM
ncbi:TRAP transporter large permease [Salinibacterium sp. M195]|uniref:TRAP transporter large permease n=1 Tax=Salinibacterium sp. M195 TaxID=2583374 RepID=UPI001C635384|nr:TRAP transporter large permease [Salinibacterium sp. M195]QYH35461.1 TRAP transporter large permease [Salinibacterium sp. M195]